MYEHRHVGINKLQHSRLQTKRAPSLTSLSLELRIGKLKIQLNGKFTKILNNVTLLMEHHVYCNPI